MLLIERSVRRIQNINCPETNRGEVRIASKDQGGDVGIVLKDLFQVIGFGVPDCDSAFAGSEAANRRGGATITNYVPFDIDSRQPEKTGAVTPDTADWSKSQTSHC
jgi:hypothetical protein